MLNSAGSELEPETEKRIGSEEELEAGTRLVLPSDCEKEWAYVQEVLASPVEKLEDLDTILTRFSEIDEFPKVCSFFKAIPGSAEAGKFDFDSFFAAGVPLMIEVALDMPHLFKGMQVPIFKTRSSWAAPGTLAKHSFTLSRRQCACLLAHSFFGSLKRPKGVERNNFRFTAVELFMGTAVSPNSATTFLNYFTILGKHGFPEGVVTFERQGYRKGVSPWQWEENEKPLCQVSVVDGAIEDSVADVHAEFANAFIGGGVMTGDFAMEEILFLIKPELMVAMAIENMMADTEAICITGALQYSIISGYGSTFEFAGNYPDDLPSARKCREGLPPRVCAIDAIRGGGPAMTEPALLRDLNKARIAFDGAREVATGHWGCGAFGNNHDLMFLKQWMAASEAGAQKMYYYDFSRKQSHSIHPLVSKLGQMTVGELWAFLQKVTGDLVPCNMAQFSKRITDVARRGWDVAKGEVQASGADSQKSKPTTGAGSGSTAQTQTVNAASGSMAKVSSPDAADTDANSFEGKVVIYKGEDMTCIKENSGRVRLQGANGKTTWAIKDDVMLKQ